MGSTEAARVLQINEECSSFSTRLKAGLNVDNRHQALKNTICRFYLSLTSDRSMEDEKK